MAEETHDAPSASPSQGAAHGQERGAERQPPRPPRHEPNPGPKREQQVMVGIVGEAGGLQAATRQVPLDEPPPLAPNAQLKSVGQPVARLDAVQKVTGQATFTYDVRLPGMLYARRVVSPLAHARIKRIDTSAAERHPGVRAVHILERTLGMAHLRDEAARKEEETPDDGKYPLVRFAGQPVAAVAATSPRAAYEAAKLVRIEWEPLPHVTDLAAAMKDDAPLVFAGPTEHPPTAGGGGAPQGLPQKGNVRGPNTGGRAGGPQGDLEKGFADADVVIEHEYRTQVQTHVPMETHGVVADWRDDGVTIYASTQFTSSVRDEAAVALGIPKNKIRVISEFTGGGFGAKYGIGNYGLLALHLSRKAGAPVRMMLDRAEEHVAVGNRPSTITKLRMGAKRDGTLTAIHAVSHGTGGVATGAGIGFCHASMYPCPNVHVEQNDVFTNAGPAAAFRAPGQVQGIHSLEQALDEIAHKLEMDPLALRDKLDTNDTDDARARRAERRVGAERFGWAEKRRPPGSDTGPVKRGVGMAQSQWLYLVRKNSACEVRVTGDGSVEAFSSAQDIGTGTRTVLAQVVAEEFGLRPDQVGSFIGDTRYPIGPPSGGSMVTSSLTPAARNAAHRAARELATRVAPLLEAKPEDVIFVDGRVRTRGNGGKSLSFKEACEKAKVGEISHRVTRADDYEGYAHAGGDVNVSKHGIGGVQFVELVVDTETGAVKVEHVVAVADCGRPINPKLTESQVLGGVIQGVSYAVYEQRHLDARSGHQVNANVDQYKVVGSKETPRIDVVLLEQLTGQSSTDARGVAEPANCPTAAAVANAFFNATGKRIYDLPLTPANVLAALQA